jgi:hypothetical protein
MKNKIVDLNNHLFAQLERLSDETLSPEQLDREVKRTDAIVAVADQLVRSAAVSLGAAKLIAENSRGREAVAGLPMLNGRELSIEDRRQ